MRYTHRIELVSPDGQRFPRFCTYVERGGAPFDGDIVGAGDWSRVYTVMSPPPGVTNDWRIVDLTEGRLLFKVEAVETTRQLGRRIKRAAMEVFASRQGNRIDPPEEHDLWAAGAATWALGGDTWGVSP